MSASWWVEVDGVVLPKQLAGHPALELCNTRAGWRSAPDPRGEYLRSYDALALVAQTSGALPEDVVNDARAAGLHRPAAAAREVDRARAIRADLYAIWTGSASKTARGRVASGIAAARARQRLVIDGDSATWEFGTPGVADPLDALLVASGELLADSGRAPVVACPGIDCGWLFLNTSRRRRWCQMAVCGNRAKQAAFSRRAHS
ncbi:CGNR zinc finger domain-containing protein [Flexivirga meconopsidis]|uniref:CGNR zinc finger domain-containing protein n=1 Tax=Flexivirga meconopsidis TaxID=2977121 RepID=UPI00223FD1B6|nr:CGNR zinc finger domain-containing protein [Flexivirga meconopsidis]